MIQYTKSDGTVGEFNSDNLSSIDVKGHTLTVTLRYYGYDEYDFWYDEIDDIVELKML